MGKNIKRSKDFGFIEVNDGSFFKGIQVVYDNQIENFEEISHLSITSSITVCGIFIESEGKGQPSEIVQLKIDNYQKAIFRLSSSK